MQNVRDILKSHGLEGIVLAEWIKDGVRKCIAVERRLGKVFLNDQDASADPKTAPDISFLSSDDLFDKVTELLGKLKVDAKVAADYVAQAKARLGLS